MKTENHHEREVFRRGTGKAGEWSRLEVWQRKGCGVWIWGRQTLVRCCDISRPPSLLCVVDDSYLLAPACGRFTVFCDGILGGAHDVTTWSNEIDRLDVEMRRAVSALDSSLALYPY